MSKSNIDFDLAKIDIPVLKKEENEVLRAELVKFSNSTVIRGEEILKDSPELTEQELAIRLAKEDLKKTKKFSLKRKILKKVIKSLENEYYEK